MSDLEDIEDEEATSKRLKAALHYTVGKICDSVAENKDVTFERRFSGAVAELAFHQIKLFAGSLEDFASHAKRSVIKSDDVKMLVRKSPELHQYISNKEKSYTAEKEDTSTVAVAGPSKKKRKTTN